MPPEFVDYLLCKTFHWTPVELDNQSHDRIMQFLTIMRIEGAFENMKSQELQQEVDKQHG